MVSFKIITEAHSPLFLAQILHVCDLNSFHKEIIMNPMENQDWKLDPAVEKRFLAALDRCIDKMSSHLLETFEPKDSVSLRILSQLLSTIRTRTQYVRQERNMQKIQEKKKMAIDSSEKKTTAEPKPQAKAMPSFVDFPKAKSALIPNLDSGLVYHKT
jgi:hypothetical protein